VSSPDKPRRSAARWLWLGLAGCLACGLAAATPLACVGLLAIRSRQQAQASYEVDRLIDESITAARTDPRVVARLGEPVTSRRALDRVRPGLRGAERSAVVHLEGPLGEGELYLTAERLYGEWHMREVRFVETQRRTIDLLEDGGAPGR
jgi:Cytochrome oxidase complex assembly protein 1